MTAPHKFRPSNVDDSQWENNWLSNSLAWCSAVFTPRWCSTEKHWTAKVTGYLFTDCPCCLLWRGLVLGFFSGILTAGMLL